MVNSAYGCMRWLFWFRHYAINRKVTDSIPDVVTKFINLTNPCIRTIAVGSTNPLAAINTGYLRVGKGNADSGRLHWQQVLGLTVIFLRCYTTTSRHMGRLRHIVSLRTRWRRSRS
jgi:hypothetical protein